MRTAISFGVVLALFSFSPPSSAAQSETKKKPTKVISLSGCLQRDEASPQQYVIDDAQEGKYRVSGKDFSEFIGRRVTVDGGVASKGLVVQGGLTPNANIAAQAGGLDPSRAAVQAATQPGGPNATSSLPEFRVKKIAAAAGNCQ